MFFIIFCHHLQGEEVLESKGESWAFLKIGIGARAMGMGGAYVALADDATAPYWNPAGLSLLGQKSATAMYVQPNSATGIGIHGYLSYCHPTEEFGSFGISFNSFRIDDIIPTIATPDGDFMSNGEPENDSQWALILSYALPLNNLSPENQKNPRIFFGTNFRIMSQDFMGYSTKGLGSDLGVIVTIIDKNLNRDIPIENLRVGYALKYNAKRSWNWDEKQKDKDILDYSDPASLGWQLGSSSKIPLSPSTDMIFSASFIKFTEGIPLAYAFGTELKILKVMAMRVGLLKMKESSIVTGGFGIGYKLIQVDYAISSESLGIKQRVSLSVNF